MSYEELGGSGQAVVDQSNGGAPIRPVIHLPRSWVPRSRDAVSERIELGQLWTMLRERLPFIGICAAVVVVIVLGATLAGGMVFRARGSIYLGDLQEKGGAQATAPDQFDFLGGRNGDVGTEIEILKSRTLIKRAILDSGINVSLSPIGWTSPSYLRWRLAHRDLDLLDVGTKNVIATNVALSRAAHGPKSFVIHFSTDRTYEISQSGHPVGKGTLGVALATNQLTLTLEPGPEGRPSGGAKFEMVVAPLDQTADAVAHGLNVTMAKSSVSNEQVKVVTLDLGSSSPRAAAAFVGALMSAYLERRQSWKSEEATAAEIFVTGQVKAVKESLDAAEGQLAEYKRGSNVVMLGDSAKEMIGQLAKYEEQRMAARLQLASFDQIDRALKSQRAAPIEQYLVGDGSDSVLAGLSNELGQSQQELTSLDARFTDDAPQVREQQAKVKQQLKAIKNYVLGKRARAQGQLDSLDGMIEKFEEKLKTVPRAEQQLAQLTRHTEALSKVYSFLLERQQQVAVVRAATISKNHILDIPETPYREESPTLSVRLVCGVAAGLLLGLVLALLGRVMAGTFQTEKELRRELGDLPLFGTIPQRELATDPKGPPAVDVFAADPHSAFAEAFRHLRANIYYSGPMKDDKVIVVTSPNQGDGKTLCTLSLAASLAADGRRVLVIEGDMHRPIHHTLFKQEQQPGLSSLLTRQVTWVQAVQEIGTAFGTFDAIMAGPVPPSPTELLSSPQFGALVAQAKKSYDFVLIDSPPFPLVSDALVMSMLADRVLTVVRLKNTQRRTAEEHLRRISAATPRYGVIINGIDARTSDGIYGGQTYSTIQSSLGRSTAGFISRWNAKVGASSGVIIAKWNAKIRAGTKS